MTITVHIDPIGLGLTVHINECVPACLAIAIERVVENVTATWYGQRPNSHTVSIAHGIISRELNDFMQHYTYRDAYPSLTNVLSKLGLRCE